MKGISSNKTPEVTNSQQKSESSKPNIFSRLKKNFLDHNRNRLTKALSERAIHKNQYDYDEYLEKTNWKKKGCLGEAINTLMSKDKNSRAKLDHIFSELSNGLFNQKKYPKNYKMKDLVVFLQLYKEAITSEKPDSTIKGKKRLENRLEALDELIKFTKELHIKERSGKLDDSDKELWMKIILPCAGRVRESNLVEQDSRPYCNLYTALNISYDQHPRKVVRFVLNLAQSYIYHSKSSDKTKLDSMLPIGYTVVEPMVDDLVIGFIFKDKIDNGKSGSNAADTAIIYDWLQIPHELLYNSLRLGLKLGALADLVRTSEEIDNTTPTQRKIAHHKTIITKLNKYIKEGHKIAGTLPPMAIDRINAAIGANYLASDSKTPQRKATTIADPGDVVKAATYYHAVEIRGINLIGDSDHFFLKFHTWGKSYNIRLPVAELDKLVDLRLLVGVR